jgi:hypothetical protein
VESVEQGSFFRRLNTEGLTLVGLFMEGTTLTCLETYSDAKKTNPGVELRESSRSARARVPASERPGKLAGLGGNGRIFASSSRGR